VTSVIIGPRTMEHLESQLAAADVVLPRDVLDRIDEIVPPGVTINRRRLGQPRPAAHGTPPPAMSWSRAILMRAIFERMRYRWGFAVRW
jgi:hypothetical protein